MQHTIGPYKPLSDIKADLILNLTWDFKSTREAIANALLELYCSQGISNDDALTLLYDWISEVLDGRT